MSKSPLEPELVTVERIAPGGSGVGRLASGEVVFIAGTALGDLVRLSAVTRRKGVAHATIEQLESAGPDRVVPTCSHATRCGGCDFMHLSLAGQQQAKLAILRDALTRTGGNTHGKLDIDFVTSEQSLGYRSRIRLHVDNRGQVGLLSARSHDVVCIDRCAVATPRINAAIELLEAPSDASRRLLALCQAIELREAASAPHLSARIFARPKINLQARSFAPLFAPDTLIVVADQLEATGATQDFSLPQNVVLQAPISAFTQVNQDVNQKLITAVLTAAARHGVNTFVDAYAGAGNFTLPLLACGFTGEAIDTCSAGIYRARRAARDRGWPHDGFQVGDARALLESFARAKRTFDMVLLDPPRQGSKDVLDVALKLQPRLVVLVACDPVTLARDLKWLVSQGASVESLTIFDMFPQTHHFETLACVRARVASGPPTPG